jgi:23S rRNA (uracil1939-C5)-methyltransferase
VKHRKPAKKPAPVEKTVEIHSLSHEAHGVSRSQDKVVFVPGALPTETVKIRIDRPGRHFDQAQLLAVDTPSAERITPKCGHYDKCGACQLQHLQSDKQLGYKQADLHQQITRKLKVEDLPWQSPIESEPYGYRRRARLGVRYRNKLDEIILGFREEANSHLTAIESCPVLHPALSDLIQPLHDIISQLQGKSVITQVELIIEDHGPVIVLRHIKNLSTSDREQLNHWAQSLSTSLWLQGDESLEVLHQLSEEPLTYQIDDCQIHFGVKDFIQGNEQVNHAMVKTAIEWLELTESDTVLDLFAGVGNFTLPIAKQVQQVYAIEGEKGMAQRIAENTAVNGINNVSAQAMNLADDSLLSRLPKADAILLDPPRAGAAAMMPWLAKQKSRILYIACEPSSLVRDAKALLEAGFKIEKIAVMDMFPQTKHVESMALFVRKSS